jgi:hypothetical protein
MKKRLLSCFVALFFTLSLVVSLAWALKWWNVNTFSCSWDTVITDVDGDPLPSDTTVMYRVHLANAVTDPNKASPTVVSEVSTPNTAITLNTKGQFYVGVEAVLLFIEDNSEMVSGINWADEIADQDTVELWAIRHHAPPLKPQKFIK